MASRRELTAPLITGPPFSAKSKFTEHTFGVKERFDRLKDQDRHYLAHEYFNKDWQPMYFKGHV